MAPQVSITTFKRMIFCRFIMTKAEEARVITHYQDALEMKHQFVLRLVDGNWLLDEKFYGFEDEETWYLDSL